MSVTNATPAGGPRNGKKRKRVLPSMDECHDVAKQLQHNEAQIKRLQADSHRLLRSLQVTRWNSKAKEKACNRYAQIGCLEVCVALLSKLPREIRDLIYANVVNDWDFGEVIIEFDEYNGSPSSNARALFGNRFWLLPEFVGPDVALEMVQMFYRKNTFDLYGHGQLPLFLNDRSLSNVAPIDFVRDITVRILTEDLAREFSKQWKFYTSIPELVWVTSEFICRPFRLLHFLQRSVTIRIELLSEYEPVSYGPTGDSDTPSDDEDATIEAIVACLQPLLLKMKANGHIEATLSLSYGDGTPGMSGLTPLAGVHPRKWAKMIQDHKQPGIKADGSGNGAATEDGREDNEEVEDVEEKEYLRAICDEETVAFISGNVAAGSSAQASLGAGEGAQNLPQTPEDHARKENEEFVEKYVEWHRKRYAEDAV